MGGFIGGGGENPTRGGKVEGENAYLKPAKHPHTEPSKRTNTYHRNYKMVKIRC